MYMSCINTPDIREGHTDYVSLSTHHQPKLRPLQKVLSQITRILTVQITINLYRDLPPCHDGENFLDKAVQERFINLRGA